MHVILDLFGTLPQIKKTLTSLENQDFQDMIVLCIIKKNLVSYRTLNQIKRLYKNSSLTLHFIPEGATFPSGVISDEYNYLLLKTGDYFIENNNIVKLKEKIQNRNAIFLLKNDKQINNHYIFSYPEKFNHTVHSIVDKQNFILDYDYNRLILKGDFLNESIIFANWDDIQKCLRQKIILDDNNIYHLKNDSMVSNFLWIRKYYLSQTVIQTRLIDIYHTISSYNEIADKDLIVQFFNKDLILILERILSYPNNEEIIIFIKKIIESVPEDLSQLFDLKNRLLLAFISSHSFSTSNDVEIALQHYFTPLKIANFDNNSEHVSTESLKLILHETVHSNNTALTIDNIIYKEKSIHIKGNLYLENAFLIDLSMLNFYFSHITNKQSARIYPQKINWFSNPKYLSKRGGKLHRRGFKLSYDNDILPSSFEMIFELNDTGFDPGCYHLFLSNRINNEINDFHLQLNPVTRRSYSNSFISTNNQQIFIDVDKNNFPYLFVNDTTELESLYFENNQLYLTAQPEITPILYHRKETLSAVKKNNKISFFPLDSLQMQQPDEVTRYKVCLPDLTNIIFKDMDISKTYYNQGNFFHLAYNKQRTLILSIVNCYVKTISKRFNKNKLQLCLEIDSTLGNTPQLNISKDSFFKRLSHQKIENRQFTYEIDLSDPAYTAMYSGQYELSIHASEKSYLITDTLEPTEKRIQNYYYSVSSNNNYSLQIKVTDQKIRKSTSLKLDFIKQIAFPMMQKYLPKQQKVFFESFSTKTYSDNPKAISDFLRQHHPNVKQTWSLDNQKNRLPDKMTKVKLGTFMYYFELATSKVIVTNFNAPHILKTQKQYLIQTMHGVPLKKMGLPIMTDFKSRKLLQDTVRNWDLFTSTSDYLNSIVLESYQYDGDIIPSGYPRNDFLIQNKDNLDLKHNILKSLQIANDKKIILYAPTWRNKSSFDFKFTLSELEKNLGDDYVLIVRAHYFVDKFVDSSIFSTKVINGQHIVDVKELLLISDILITDYSSIMFDFSLLERPILLYTYDFKKYSNGSRSTYFRLDEEFPEMICHTENDIYDKINTTQISGDLISASKDMKAKFNTFDQGDASEKISQVILNYLKR